MFRGRTKLSKYGNARLRRTFWMAAQVAGLLMGLLDLRIEIYI